jgi:hypothetical protein
MSGETVENNATEVVNDNQVEESTETTQTGASADDVAELKAALEKQSALIEKLRQHEQQSLEAEKAAKREKQTEVERVTELYEQKLNSLALDGALESALASHGVRNVEVAKKVLDTSGINVADGRVDKQAVQQAVAALKESESYLFKTTEETPKKQAPKVGAADEGATEDVVQKAIKGAKSVRELNEILRKYNVKTAG